MSAFADLGLSTTLVEAAAALGWDAPLPLQRAAIPVLRRGGNAVVRGSSGAGITGAYGLALLDRLAAGETAGAGTRVLVLVRSATRAHATASTLARLARGTARVAALAPGWRDAAGADVLVATPEDAAAGVAGSALKLSGVEVLVLEDVPALLAAGAAEALETVLVSIPAESQRVLTTPKWSRDVDRLAEAHARRALSIPSRPADPQSEVGAARGTVAYTVIPAHAREDVLAQLLDAGAHGVVVARSAARAAAVRDALAARGYVAGSAEDNVTITHFGSDVAEGATLAYDVPSDSETLAKLGANAIVLAAPSEQPHLRTIAEEAGLTLQPAPPPREPRTALDAFREEIRRALQTEDVDAQLGVLEPLFDEYSPAEIAGALSALLRSRKPATRPAEAAAPKAAEAGARGRPFVRLFVSVGQKDGLRPAEVVGAFTSEAGITGEQVGRIEIRETFSVVEVDPDVADRVIRAINGTTLKNRSVRVDYDRKGAPTPRRAPPRPRGKREPRG